MKYHTSTIKAESYENLIEDKTNACDVEFTVILKVGPNTDIIR